MINLDQNKLNLQNQILDSWALSYYHGTAELATAVGKTFLAILAIKRMLVKDNKRKTIVIVPTIPLKAQWEDEIILHKVPNVEVYVVNTITLNKLSITTDLLVLDEIHKYASPEFIKLFDLIDYKYILGLTATLTRPDGRHSLIEDKCPVIATVTQNQAVLRGLISEFKEYNLGIDLSPKDRLIYDKLNKDFHKYFGVFGHDFKVVMSCLSKQGSEDYANLHGLDAGIIAFQANRFNQVMRMRKEFLYKATCKIDTTVDILNKFKLKTVTFSESTEFADNLTARLGDIATCYHTKLATQIWHKNKLIALGVKSKKKTFYQDLSTGLLYNYPELKKLYPGCIKLSNKTLKLEALKSFADNRTKKQVINTAKALDVGFNVEDIMMAIITSSTTNPTQHTQRGGRVLRKYIYKDGTIKLPVIINVYIKNTQDVKWLKARQTDSKTKQLLNPNVKWIDSIDQIKL